jgi:hypothetical protein
VKMARPNSEKPKQVYAYPENGLWVLAVYENGYSDREDGIFYATGIQDQDYIPSPYRDQSGEIQKFQNSEVAEEYRRNEQRNQRRKGFKCPLEVRRG